MKTPRHERRGVRVAISKRIRWARERADLTQAEVAEAMGWVRPTVSEIEAGRRALLAEELSEPAFVPLPTGREPEVIQDHKGYPRSAEQQKKQYEQLERTRWRVFLLFIKAKLELIAMGVSSVEREFLSDVVLPDGRTVYEALEEPIARSYETGVPLLGPATGGDP